MAFVGNRRALLTQSFGDLTPRFYDMFDGPSADYRVPANIRTGLSSSTMTGGGFAVEQEYPVTGSLGATTLTCSNATLVGGMGSNPFSAAILLPSGVAFEALVMSNNGSNTLTLGYALPYAVPSGSILTSLYDDTAGQHRTKVGTRAWIQKILGRDARYTRRMNGQTGINRQTEPNPVGAPDWVKNATLAAYAGGTTNGINGFSDTDAAQNIVQTGSPARAARPASHACGTYFGMPTVGCGAETSGSLPSGGGYMELYPQIEPGTTQDAGSAGLVEIWVTNAAAVERKVASVAFGRFLQKVTADFEAGDVSYRISVTRTDNGLAWRLRLLEFRVFASGLRGLPIRPNARVLLLSDSWGAYYNGLAATELQTQLPGCQVFNRSLGGMTTRWARDWLTTYVAETAATDVIVTQCVNDLNTQTGNYTKPDGTTAPLSMGDTLTERTANWIAAIGEIAALARTARVRLHFVMPSGTASQSQAQNLANAASSLYASNLG